MNLLSACATRVLSTMMQPRPEPRLRIERNPAARQAQQNASWFLNNKTPIGRLPRPVVLLHGYFDTPVRWDDLRRGVANKVSNPDMLVAPFDLHRPAGVCAMADDIAKSLYDDGVRQCDIVAHSMGGLVGLQLATDNAIRANIHVARLHTVATPFLGTLVARIGRALGTPFSEQLRDLSPNSAIIHRLTTTPHLHTLPISTYWIQGDLTVSQKSAHAVGNDHVTLPSAWWHLPDDTHIEAPQDPRIIAAIVRSLIDDD